MSNESLLSNNPLNKNAIVATFRRQLASLFGNPLSYVFILAFVLATWFIMYYSNDFFKRNIADLDPLRHYMLISLAILIPALSMGAWASERELGTEEQLFSLPMTVLDVLIGKWLGIAAFFSITLLYSLTHVIALMGLGSPDLGGVFTLYTGWWLSGLIFVSLSLWASTLVAYPAIAFVIGIAMTCLAILVMYACSWLDPFERGLFPFSRIIMSVLLIAVPVSIAAYCLSMRRWQQKQNTYYNKIGIIVVCFCITAFNITAFFDRLALDVDLTEEGLSSLSQASIDAVESLEDTVTITAFISKTLPPELAQKGRELETMLLSIDREMGSRVHVIVKQPVDGLDKAGIEARQHYGIEPKMVFIDTITGKEQSEAFLGAVVRSGAKTQKIPFFDPGLSVEFELVRAIRTVGGHTKKVVGVVKTLFEVNGRMDYRSGQRIPSWQIVQEWGKQYDVREVTLDAAVSDDIDVLVVFQPTRLSNEEMRVLYDSIWQGKPTLILEDPMPFWSNPELASSEVINPPKQQSPFQPQQQQTPSRPQADLKPLLSSLGLHYPDNQIAWSSYNPSQEFKSFPPEFVWARADAGAIHAHKATSGIGDVLFIYPGYFTASQVQPEGITQNPLITTAKKSVWGHNSFQSVRESRWKKMKYTPAYASQPMLAVAVSGKMKNTYIKSEEKQKADEKDDTDAADKKKTQSPWSGTDVNVVFVADTDLAHDQFYHIYRNENDQFSDEGREILKTLRNVQFFGNIIDTLSGDADFMELRNRRPLPRPLTRIVEALQESRKLQTQAISSATNDAESKISALNAGMQEALKKINQRTDIDEDRRRQLYAIEEIRAQKKLNRETVKINRELERRIREQKSQERAQMEDLLFEKRLTSLATPIILLMLIIIAVFVMRMQREKQALPQGRQRSES